VGNQEVQVAERTSSVLAGYRMV